ncbi:leucyl aminopeptidase family protein [Roseomonas terrae]|jgi:leucyl aminopeptidase|uniref:Leucyl aminopeptidase family protein n=1 Tax=Neoroseomonas terrae TaxID=424799 RepID=A0ABS5EHV2_9PROT|nr:leucyl aminopeptidase family protein [Neoroseomonas terrae]MBR0650609.1 leucyl aminopeptidase family protein [Neoroseomonas terrae]
MITVDFRRTAPPADRPCIIPLIAGAEPPPALAPAIAAASFTATVGAVLDQPGVPRRMLVGLGAAPTLLAAETAGAAAALAAGPVAELSLAADQLDPTVAASVAAGIALGAWRFDALRSRDVPQHLKRLVIHAEDPDAVHRAFAAVAPGVAGCLLARDLTVEPANRLTTRRFADRLEALEAEGVEVTIHGRKWLERHGFGALLAVGGGSAFPPRLAVLRWRGVLPVAPVAFVGKGIVFDTGGISIKAAAGMEAMRADMAGAAACAGAMLALARRKSPSPAVAVLAIAENAVGAASYRPGDVIRTASRRTVEVIDTDAEGRLVLADAIHHAVTAFRPRAVIDLATLTGSIVTALGHHRAGLFGTDAALLASAAAAGEAVGEPLWPMPIGARHREDLASDVADLRQCAPAGSGAFGGRLLPDACHAAAFLREFAGDRAWAHLDIAGVETAEAAHALGPAGPTGFGARLLDRLVALRFEEEP